MQNYCFRLLLLLLFLRLAVLNRHQPVINDTWSAFFLFRQGHTWISTVFGPSMTEHNGGTQSALTTRVLGTVNIVRLAM